MVTVLDLNKKPQKTNKQKINHSPGNDTQFLDLLNWLLHLNIQIIHKALNNKEMFI
jgi:hypothetical protein